MINHTETYENDLNIFQLNKDLDLK
jgi:hypothetical protein